MQEGEREVRNKFEGVVELRPDSGRHLEGLGGGISLVRDSQDLRMQWRLLLVVAVHG